MEENYTGRLRDDATTSLDTSSDAESIYYTPLPSTPVESFASWRSGGRLHDQYGHYPGNIPQWDTNMDFDQVHRADDRVDEACEEQAYIPNEGLVNFQKSKETTPDTGYGDSFSRDTHSQAPTSWNELIDPVTRHFGAQFDLRDSKTHHEAAELETIAPSTYIPNSVEQNETSQYQSSQDLPLFDTVHHLPLYEYQRPSIVLSDPVGRTIPPVADDLYCHMLGDDSMTTTSLVQQVREILHGLNRNWMGRLESTPDLYTRCMPLSTCRLLETGIRALQLCFYGDLPSSFEDLFALMHVAFAFSIVMNRDGFQRPAYLLESGIDFGVLDLLITNHAWTPLKLIADIVFGHTTMAERHRRPTPPPAERDLSVVHILETGVAQPLTQRYASEEYWEQIKNARSRLRSGLIRDVHEFELVLISRNKSPKTSSHVHSRYMKEVTSQFDLALGLGWRNGYHATHLDLFLGLARESLGYDASKVHHCSPGLGTDLSDGTHATKSSSFLPCSSSDHFVHHNRPIVFPSSANPTGGFYTAPSDNSRSNFSSYASPVDDSFNPTNSSATSIDLLSTSSAPVTPTTRARSESASNVTLCDLCPGVKFTGKPESQRRSFRRHIQDKHSDTPRLTCSRCDATFGRSDNLKRHVEQQHHQ
ncbi:hypothetical protein JMJ35_009227 [Cladonia borealis]|uniref:C2H2-type domain-containing protein n=1 Tax=Cladonia borealis TaxID=184061 RepID=A0AA39QS40_9LECA|nr:hypothetical protein JMJ35_009227 [Cladonia borealis]